jgi:hypothetical protein
VEGGRGGGGRGKGGGGEEGGGGGVGGTSKSEGKLFQNRQDGEFYRESLKLEELLGLDKFHR